MIHTIQIRRRITQTTRMVEPTSQTIQIRRTTIREPVAIPEALHQRVPGLAARVAVLAELVQLAALAAVLAAQQAGPGPVVRVVQVEADSASMA
jgi:hypothetical protein